MNNFYSYLNQNAMKKLSLIILLITTLMSCEKMEQDYKVIHSDEGREVQFSWDGARATYVIKGERAMLAQLSLESEEDVYLAAESQNCENISIQTNAYPKRYNALSAAIHFSDGKIVVHQFRYKR